MLGWGRAGTLLCSGHLSFLSSSCDLCSTTFLPSCPVVICSSNVPGKMWVHLLVTPEPAKQDICLSRSFLLAGKGILALGVLQMAQLIFI